MDAPDKEKKSHIEYTAQAASSVVNGEVKLKIGKDSFTAAGLFDIAEIPYVSVNSIAIADYIISVKTDEGNYTFSRMGNLAQPFFDTLYGAYSDAMLRAFFIKGNPVATASGDYRFTENSKAVSGKAPVHIYENCVVSLPPSLDARRIPLCFAIGMDKPDFGFTLKLNMGEEYTVTKLGNNTAFFIETVEKQIRALREKTVAVIKEIDPTLTAAQASQLSMIVPEGVAASMGQLSAIAPSFAEAIKGKILQTRAADSYNAFKEVCDPDQIWVGFKKNDAQSKGDGSGGTEPDPYLFWMIAPSPNGQYVAVEFAVQPGESAATYVYRTDGDVSKSAMYLNRAMEAISFKRDAIRLTDEELRKPEYADYYMASRRTDSLKYVRSKFAGRVIHLSQESWRQKLMELWKN